MKKRIPELRIVLPALAVISLLPTSCDNPQLISQRSTPEESNEEEKKMPPHLETQPTANVRDADMVEQTKPTASTTGDQTNNATPASDAPPEPTTSAEEEIGSPLPLNIFPFERNLTGKNGKVIEAEVIGRIEDNIVFKGKGGDQEYNVPISSLADEDRKYCLRLPKIRPRILSKAAQKRNDPYVQSRTEQKEELAARRKALSQKISKESNKINVRSMRSEMKRIQEEFDKLNEEIDKYLEQN